MQPVPERHHVVYSPGWEQRMCLGCSSIHPPEQEGVLEARCCPEQRLVTIETLVRTREQQTSVRYHQRERIATTMMNALVQTGAVNVLPHLSQSERDRGTAERAVQLADALIEQLGWIP